ncbi:hypothetical protein [Propionimicrobium lymphophilum]|uniref:hypothetical protein n=1 Tax=Propionimicrobium lymphophilum TaxID=33012 RepID=UPI00288B75BC|nr:hypothetical protein [Propionimicrobium lymphophilum]
MAKRYAITKWQRNLPNADSSKAALFLPGKRYAFPLPGLIFPALALRDAGWAIWYADIDMMGLEDEEIRSLVNEALAEMSAQAGAKQQLVVAKSIGSMGAKWTAENSVPAVWFTPVLNDAQVVDDIKASTAPQLLIGGTSDSYWDTDAARSTGGEIVEVEGRDHSFLVRDWRSVLEDTGLVTEKIEEFVSKNC